MAKPSQPSVLDPALVERYSKDGFVIVEGLFSQPAINSVMNVIYRLYRKAVPGDTELDTTDSPWDSVAFDNKLIGLREAEPRIFGALYDAAQNAFAPLRLLISPKAASAAADVLGDQAENLSCSGVLLRMDPPFDKRSVLDWHQDRAYFPQNFHGSNGVVLSVLLNDTDEAIGALRLCPGSHREGYLAPRMEAKNDHFTTEQRRIDDHVVAKYPQVDAIGRKGDALLFDMNMFHRSGENRGERIRYSAIIRFHRMLSEDYVPSRWVETYNDFVQEQVEQRFGATRQADRD